jgi:1-acyl-sn-glycerol-3-phosphate acyltransferase
LQLNERIRRWSARLLDILAIQLEATGIPPSQHAECALVLSNHISWLDIFAIDAVRAVRFVAKAELRRWPFIGWLLERSGTLFIERAQRRHTAEVNERVTAAMARGEMFGVFPEGATGAGDCLRPFHASLLQPALANDATLCPVAICYTRIDGTLCREAEYGERNIFESLGLILSQPAIRAELNFLPHMATAGRHRRELAREAETLIAQALNLSAPSTKSGRSAALPT